MASESGWDNTAIWSGDLIRYQNGFAFYYTSRDSRVDQGLTQNIGLAISQNLTDWHRIKTFRLQPDRRWYEPSVPQGSQVVHAWRDPFLFRHAHALYMIVAAQSHAQVSAYKGAVGLLVSPTQSLLQWEALPPLFDPGVFAECEVPQVYHSNGKIGRAHV